MTAEKQQFYDNISKELHDNIKETKTLRDEYKAKIAEHHISSSFFFRFYKFVDNSDEFAKATKMKATAKAKSAAKVATTFD